MRTIYLGSLIFWLIVLIVFISGGDESYATSPYLLDGYVYNSYSDLFGTLFIKPNNLNLFEKCCDIINFIGRTYGYSYQDINIIIFVLLSPILIINLLIITIIQGFLIKKLKY